MFSLDTTASSHRCAGSGVGLNGDSKWSLGVSVVSLC